MAVQGNDHVTSGNTLGKLAIVTTLSFKDWYPNWYLAMSSHETVVLSSHVHLLGSSTQSQKFTCVKQENNFPQDIWGTNET